MLYRTTLALIAIAVSLVAAFGQVAPRAFKSPPPRFVLVETVGRDELILTELSIAPEIVDVGGKPAARVRVSPEQYRVLTFSFSLKKGRVLDTKGNNLSVEDIKKRLLPGRVVLLSSDGKAVDPVYLSVVKDDTVVLVGQPTKQ